MPLACFESVFFSISLTKNAIIMRCCQVSIRCLENQDSKISKLPLSRGESFMPILNVHASSIDYRNVRIRKMMLLRIPSRGPLRFNYLRLRRIRRSAFRLKLDLKLAPVTESGLNSVEIRVSSRCPSSVRSFSTMYVLSL